MKCMKCGAATKTLETRQECDGVLIRRRRKCESCGHRFSSYEINENLFGTLQKYMDAHLRGVHNTWRITQRNEEIVRRVMAGEKRMLLAAEYGLSVSGVTSITLKAGIPSRKRFKPQRHDIPTHTTH